MKPTNSLLILFFLVVLFACNDDDVELKDPDFSVLGITSVSINDSVYQVDESMKLQNTGSTIGVSAAGLEQAQMSGMLTYAIITQSQDTQSVVVTSCYSDVSIVETTEPSGIEPSPENVTVLKFEITRPGYDEDFTYRFGFVNFD